jgi:hypothetical protein
VRAPVLQTVRKVANPSTRTACSSIRLLQYFLLLLVWCGSASEARTLAFSNKTSKKDVFGTLICLWEDNIKTNLTVL